jgi:hypothetical protein
MSRSEFVTTKICEGERAAAEGGLTRVTDLLGTTVAAAAVWNLWVQSYRRGKACTGQRFISWAAGLAGLLCEAGKVVRRCHETL